MLATWKATGAGRQTRMVGMPAAHQGALKGDELNQ